jgi:hypothetical protein
MASDLNTGGTGESVISVAGGARAVRSKRKVLDSMIHFKVRTADDDYFAFIILSPGAFHIFGELEMH